QQSLTGQSSNWKRADTMNKFEGIPQHKYMMRGQVVESSDNRTLICIGAKHGAEVGQKYSVIRFHERIVLSEGEDPYTIEKVGTVQITKIVNDHFATVKLVSGDVAAKDMVELEN
uniref:hypothetical protein n=1 Tax=Rheinheimera sp. TaxID=1869214 RepID=UPI0040479630